jgi:hypothetical protein
MAKILQFPTPAKAESEDNDIRIYFCESPGNAETDDDSDDDTPPGPQPGKHFPKITEELLGSILNSKRFIKTDEELEFMMQAVELYNSGNWKDRGGFCTLSILGHTYSVSELSKITTSGVLPYSKQCGYDAMRIHFYGIRNKWCNWPVHLIHTKSRAFEDRREAWTIVVLACCYDAVRLQDDITYVPLKDGKIFKLSTAAKDFTKEWKKQRNQANQADTE